MKSPWATKGSTPVLAIGAFVLASLHIGDVLAQPVSETPVASDAAPNETGSRDPKSSDTASTTDAASKETDEPLPAFHPRASDSSSPRDDELTRTQPKAGAPSTNEAGTSVPSTSEAEQNKPSSIDPKTGEPRLKREKERSLCPEVCSQDEACIHGRCVSACSPSCREGTFCAPSGDCLPTEVDENPRTESDVLRIAGAESAKSTEAIVLDVGGFIFQGIAAGYEWGAIDTLTTRIQIMNTGLANYSVEPQNEFERFEFGVGASLGYRHYESLWGHLRGFYFGGGAQYQLVHVVDDQRDLVSRTTHIVAPYGEIGYRWVYGSLLFGFGPHVMIRFPIAHGLASHGEGSCVATDSCSTPGAARFEGTLVLEVGLLQ